MGVIAAECAVLEVCKLGAKFAVASPESAIQFRDLTWVEWGKVR